MLCDTHAPITVTAEQQTPLVAVRLLTGETPAHCLEVALVLMYLHHLHWCPHGPMLDWWMAGECHRWQHQQCLMQWALGGLESLPSKPLKLSVTSSGLWKPLYHCPL